MLNIPLDNYIAAFDKTPKKIKDVLFADYTSAAIKNITHRHNVQNRMLDISATIGYVLVGLVPIKNIITTLQEEAEIDQKTARNVAYEIREQIFAPIAQELAALQQFAAQEWERMVTSTQNRQAELVSAEVKTGNDESVIRESIASTPKVLKDIPIQTPEEVTPIETPQKNAPTPPTNLPTQPSQKNIPQDNHLDLRKQRDPRF